PALADPAEDLIPLDLGRVLGPRVGAGRRGEGRGVGVPPAVAFGAGTPLDEAEPLAGQLLQRPLAVVAALQVPLDVRQLAPVELLFQELRESLVARAEDRGGSALVAVSHPCCRPNARRSGPASRRLE